MQDGRLVVGLDVAHGWAPVHTAPGMPYFHVCPCIRENLVGVFKDGTLLDPTKHDLKPTRPSRPDGRSRARMPAVAKPSRALWEFSVLHQYVRCEDKSDEPSGTQSLRDSSRGKSQSCSQCFKTNAAMACDSDAPSFSDKKSHHPRNPALFKRFHAPSEEQQRATK